MRIPFPRPGKWAVRLLVLFLIVASGAGVYWFRKAEARGSYPNTPVRKGEFLVLVRCRGALRARKSVGIYTPTVPGLRIAWLAQAGERVKEGESVVRFDSSSARQQLTQKEAQLKQAQASLDQAEAQAATTAEQDQTALADARFALERAQVQVEQESIVSRIKGEQSKVDLRIAEQKLRVQEAAVALSKTSSASRIASLKRQLEQVNTDVEITRDRIAKMEIKAPLTGLLTFRTNCSGAVTTAECKPYKVGDSVSSGMVIGEIPALDTLEMDIKLEEADRGRVSFGQDAIIRVDALPELSIASRITELSSLAEMRMEYPYTRSFRAYAAIPNPDPRLRPDMNGGLDVIVSRIPNAISVPSRALFTRAGKPIVYLAGKTGYRPVEVQVLARNPDEVAVSGLQPDAQVALVDIDRQEPKK